MGPQIAKWTSWIGCEARSMLYLLETFLWNTCLFHTPHKLSFSLQHRQQKPICFVLNNFKLWNLSDCNSKVATLFCLQKQHCTSYSLRLQASRETYNYFILEYKPKLSSHGSSHRLCIAYNKKITLLCLSASYSDNQRGRWRDEMSLVKC